MPDAEGRGPSTLSSLTVRRALRGRRRARQARGAARRHARARPSGSTSSPPTSPRGRSSTGQLADRCDRAARPSAWSDGYDALAEAQRGVVRPVVEQQRRAHRGQPRRPAGRALVDLFQLLQATARAEGTGVPAKGLTGSGYEGHYFWDTEIYVLPFLTYTMPGRGPQPAAVPPRHARRARGDGPPRSTSAGRCSRGGRSTARRPPPTTRRARRSTTSTPTSCTRSSSTSTSPATRPFLHRYGAEMLVETARLWADLGFFDDEGALPHLRRDRPRRVHDAGQRQRLHQPDGAAEPALRRRGRRPPRRRRPRRLRPAVPTRRR